MAKDKIVVVEDEEDLLELVAYHLSREGFAVETATTGEQGLSAVAGGADLVLLDLMLPRMDGLEVARRMKADSRTARIPIIMLTAKGEEADIVAGLTLGADDYVTKPFSPRVLLARVKAVLRRAQAPEKEPRTELSIHGLVIHRGTRQVTVNGTHVDLTFTEFEILYLLASRPGWVFTRSQIVDAVRGQDYPVTERSVDVHIVSLRKKLGPAQSAIETIRGVGYRFTEEP